MLLNCGVARKLLRFPWTTRQSNQSILKEISPKCSLEGLMLKLKLQFFVHLMQRTDSLKRPSCWERLKTGGEGDNKGWDGWMASLTRWTWVWVGSRSWWWTRRPGVLQFMGTQRIRHDWITELNWLSMYYVNEYFSLKCIHCNSKRSLHTFTPEVRQPGNCLFISSLHWKLSKNNDVA